MSTTTFAPTDEQQAIIDAFTGGGNGVIEAGAGTGKTTTLRLIAEAAQARGLSGIYIAYNKAAQLDAKASFPSNVDCRTAHSLAYATHGKKFRTRMRNQKRVSSKQVAVNLGITTPFQAGDVTLNQGQIASLATQAVARFCNSADTSIGERHVPAVDGIESKDMDNLRSMIAPFARKAWDDLQNPNGNAVYFAHDHYLKMWSLSNPVLRADFILFDEAQDANPCMASVVESQPVQKIMVGDRCQAIYGWRGAVDAMSKFDADWRLCLAQSFRFGQAVADQANKFLNMLDAPLRLKGFDKIESTLAPLDDNNVDAVLCRTNGAVMATAMEALAQDKKVAIVGGTADIKRFAWGAYNLKKGQPCDHPDLMGFNNWDDVVSYVENDAAGADLKVLVKLIDTYGTYRIIEVCDAATKEDEADLIVSTAHRSKGREWNRVRIGVDFKMPETEKLSKEETMLLYVAVTRAKKVLDCEAIAWVDYLIGQQDD